MIGTERAALDSATPAPDQPGPAVRTLEAVLRAVALRIRLQRALDAASILALAAIGIAALGLCLHKTHWTTEARLCFAIAGALPPIGLALGALRPVAALLCARLLDRAFGHADLLASAIAFSRLPSAACTPFMCACIARANAAAATLDASAALRLRRPRALAPALGLALLLSGLALLEPPKPRPTIVRTVHKPRLLQSEDARAFREEVASIVLAKAIDPQVRDTANELNRLIEALNDQRLERAEALGQLRGLERRLDAELHEDDSGALREALRDLGRTLGHDSLAQSVADALRDADAAKARAELERLAQKLREQTQKPDALHGLADALAKSAAQRAAVDAQARIAQARAEIDRLLKRKQQDPSAQAERERLLHKKQRELDRLEREQGERSNAERQLDGLKRELSSASQNLRSRDPGQGADHLQRGADELKKAAGSQASEEKRRQLREKVQQLRELLSKQRTGQTAQSGPGSPNGKQGQPGTGAGQQRLNLGDFARAARGQGQQPGQPNQKPNGKLFVPGEGNGQGDSLLMQQSDDSVQSQSERAPLEKIGTDEPGHGGRPDTEADPSRLASTRVDTRVRAEQSEGPARSDVILEAGQRGFASRAYQKVHGEYERHAESVLERDKIPGGYRFYVRRYFQLIRPREANDE